MNTTLVKTCELVTTQMPLVDLAFGILRNQWLMLGVVFLFIPLVITALTISNIYNTNKIKKREIRDKLILSFILTQAISFVAYLVLLSYDFGILHSILESIR